MVKKADVPKLALAAALDLAATAGWRDTTLRDIAEAAGCTLAQLRDVYPSKGAILDAFTAEIDDKVLQGDSAELAAESAKDRLFDVLMRRFDALAPHRDAVAAIARASTGDPCTVAGSGFRLLRSMRWMLEAAGIDSSGLRGRLRAKALGALYLSVLRVWLSDDSEDMARTMAALDRRLGQADRVMAGLCRLGRPARRHRAEPVDTAA